MQEQKNKKVCFIDGCESKVVARNMCGKHYSRWRLHGDPLHKKNNNKGKGTIASGYRIKQKDGVRYPEHRLVVEQTLGRKIPEQAVIHHVDGNPLNNNTDNLVVCPNSSYHTLIHKRQRALEACGNPNWQRCHICKSYSPPEEMRYPKSSNVAYHADCAHRYQKNYKLNKQESRVCSVDGCEKFFYAKGFCITHYQRWFTYGDPTYKKRRAPGEGSRRGENIPCTIEGCNGLFYAKGLCLKHYTRSYRFGDPMICSKEGTREDQNE